MIAKYKEKTIEFESGKRVMDILKEEKFGLVVMVLNNLELDAHMGIIV